MNTFTSPPLWIPIKPPPWQPIETAPKDGTEVLVFGKWFGEIAKSAPDAKPEMHVAKFYEHGVWNITGGDTYASWVKATHWMPLPTPPEMRDGK